MMVLDCGYDRVPEQMEWVGAQGNTFKDNTEVSKDFTLYNAVGVSEVFVPFEHKVMIIDPAGSGGDEIGFSIGGATNSYIYILSIGGYAGGCTPENMDKVILKMISTGTKVLDIEKNMGHGTVLLLFTSHIDGIKNKLRYAEPSIQPLCDKAGLSMTEMLHAVSGIGLNEYHVVGQKERRIIDTISPVTRKHKIVLTVNAIKDDWEHCKQHRPDQRKQYSGLYQLGNITYDRNSLVHDDRADTVQRLVDVLKGFLSKDAEKAARQRTEKEVREWMDNPMGYDKGVLKQFGETSRGRNRILGKRRR